MLELLPGLWESSHHFPPRPKRTQKSTAQEIVAAKPARHPFCSMECINCIPNNQLKYTWTPWYSVWDLDLKLEQLKLPVLLHTPSLLHTDSCWLRSNYWTTNSVSACRQWFKPRSCKRPQLSCCYADRRGESEGRLHLLLFGCSSLLPRGAVPFAVQLPSSAGLRYGQQSPAHPCGYASPLRSAAPSPSLPQDTFSLSSRELTVSA